MHQGNRRLVSTLQVTQVVEQWLLHTSLPSGAYADRSDVVPTCPVMTPFSGQSVHAPFESVELVMRT